MAFIFPQKWITPAILAGVTAFGSIDHETHIKYRNLPGTATSGYDKPNVILIDRASRKDWPREKAQCSMIHQYGHLAGKDHSDNPRSIMYPVLRYKTCHRFLVRHGIR